MIVPPDTQYATRDGVHLAYQAVGEADRPWLVYVAGSWSCSQAWEEATYVRGFNRLLSFCRLVTFDSRGAGLSDPLDVNHLPVLEDRVADLAAVIVAAGASSPAVFGTHDGGAVAALYAATHPVSHLILCNTWARLGRTPDFPIGFEERALDAMEALYQKAWGTGAVASRYTSERDESDARNWGRHERGVASPGQAVGLFRTVRELDIRGVLESITVPTLVVHVRNNEAIPAEHGRYLADHVPGAEYVEVPGRDQAFLRSHANPVFAEVEQFMTGARRQPAIDASVATILFTDIVGSTEQAARLGDERWRKLLDQHHRQVRRAIARHSGREIKTLGDGFLVAFNGPVQAIRCASDAQAAVASLDLELRAGLHVGEVQTTYEGDIAGLAVHIAQRVSALATAGEVLVTGTAKDLAAGSGLTFEDRGPHELRGIPSPQRVFRVLRDRTDNLR